MPGAQHLLIVCRDGPRTDGQPGPNPREHAPLPRRSPGRECCSPAADHRPPEIRAAPAVQSPWLAISAMTKLFPSLIAAVAIVRPETVLRGHRSLWKSPGASRLSTRSSSSTSDAARSCVWEYHPRRVRSTPPSPSSRRCACRRCVPRRRRRCATDQRSAGYTTSTLSPPEHPGRVLVCVADGSEVGLGSPPATDIAKPAVCSPVEARWSPAARPAPTTAGKPRSFAESDSASRRPPPDLHRQVVGWRPCGGQPDWTPEPALRRARSRCRQPSFADQRSRPGRASRFRSPKSGSWRGAPARCGT